MKKIERFKCWLARYSLRKITNIDYSIKRGDLVEETDGGFGRTWVVCDLNWALLSVAVKDRDGSQVRLFCAWTLKKVRMP